MCVCVRACMRACMHVYVPACVCVGGGGGGGTYLKLAFPYLGNSFVTYTILPE